MNSFYLAGSVRRGYERMDKIDILFYLITILYYTIKIVNK